MALPMAALANLSLMVATKVGPFPVVTALLWPFVLKLSFSFRPLREGCTDMLHAMRLFFFQMGHIILDREPNGGMQWRRAFRLVNERIIRARGVQSTVADEESLVAVSILAL
ncbi:hypothetical protein OROMI_029961 [Orobanche minor]